MKRIILIASVLTLILTMSGNVYATDATSSDAAPAAIQETVSGSADDTQQTREERKAFRADLQEKREVVKENRDRNKAISLENKSLRETLKARLDELKDSGTTLDAETAAKLEESIAELKSLTAALKETKGDIKEIISENKGNAKALDYEAMDAAYAEIDSIQSFRYEQLVQINEILKEMIELL